MRVPLVLGVVVGGVALVAGPAVAAPSQAGAAFVCGTTQTLSNGPGRVLDFTTTGGCLDININLTSATVQTFGRSCLNPGGAEQCSAWKLLPFGWTTLSTNVRGGTRFSVDLSGNNGNQIGYQIAY